MNDPEPPTAQATLERARAALAVGRYTDAVAGLRALADGGGATAREAGLLLGRALRASGDAAGAIPVLQDVLNSTSATGDAEGAARALSQLASISDTLSAPDDAATLYAEALTLSPTLTEAVTGLSRLHAAQGRFDDARALLEAALARRPDAPGLLVALGTVLAESGAPADAEAALARAIEIQPDFGEAHSNLGNVLRDQGRTEEAERHYEIALEHLPEGAPGHARARVNRAMMHLLQGAWSEGWDDYEWRLRLPEARNVAALPPAWDGSPLRQHTLLLYHEQGIGDVVMFATLIPELAGTGANVILWVPERLRALLARALPDCIVATDPGPEANCINADVSLALGSLPRLLRRDAEMFTGRGPTTDRPFLQADGQALERWRARVSDAAGDAPVFGFAWRGGATHWDRMLRRTAPRDWGELLSLPGIHWVALQYGMTEDEAAAFAAFAPGRIHAFPDTGADFDDFAALVTTLDGIVSVDNSTVHIAAALGRPTVTLVPHVPTWRWGLAGAATPWYPAMRLARRNPSKPWESVISGLAPWVGKTAR